MVGASINQRQSFKQDAPSFGAAIQNMGICIGHSIDVGSERSRRQVSEQGSQALRDGKVRDHSITQSGVG